MKVCDLCKARFSDDQRACPLDGSPLKELADPLLGRTIAGRYIIVEKLGAGGMGSVYRAHHEIVGRDVALKFLATELAIDPTARQRFLREARATNRIQHEHIISITDFGETDDGLVFLVMEFLAGATLGHAIHRARGPLEIRRALHIAMQIASALGRAHELGVVHRDIKPDNIFLTAREDGSDFAKILDFGLAHMKGELRLTTTGSILGTVEYMAPEHARGQALGPSVDLYALGCVLFEMLTGRLPFIGPAADAIIAQHLRSEPLPPSHFTRGISPTLDALVLALLAKKPADRPRNAHVVHETLRLLFEELAGTGARIKPRSGQSQITQRIAPKSGNRSASGEHRTIRGESVFWDERVAFFAKVSDQMHGSREKSPPWVREVIAQLEGYAAEMKNARTEIEDSTKRSSALENEARETQLRIGRALDELLRDEALTDKRIEAEREHVAQLEIDQAQIQTQIDAFRRRLTMGRIDRSVAESIREMGTHAERWLAVDRELVEATGKLHQSARAREDLGFQVSQLKGRLGTAAVDREHELDELRKRTQGLQQRISKAVEEIVRVSAPLVALLMADPTASALLRGDSGGGARLA